MAGGFLFGLCSACCECTGCECCEFTCCLTIQGRNAECESGTELISADPIIVENWGLEINAAQWLYISDERDIEVIVGLAGCENGIIPLDVIVNERVPGGPGGFTSTRRWANAVAILGEDGCPTGVDLGELTESVGPEPAFTLNLSYICT